MIRKILNFVVFDKSKIVLLLGVYIVFTELIKSGAEIYLLEQSLEIKLILFSLVLIVLYKISDLIIIITIEIFLILSLFGLPSGFLIYIFVFYSFVRRLRNEME